MDTVREIELAHAADALEDEGNERGVVFLGNIAEDRFEFLAIVAAHIGRHHHAGQYYLYSRILCAGAIDNCLQILAGRVYRKSSQPILAPQLQNQDIDPVSEEPLHAVQATGTGITALAGIDDFELPALGIDLLLN